MDIILAANPDTLKSSHLTVLFSEKFCGLLSRDCLRFLMLSLIVGVRKLRARITLPTMSSISTTACAHTFLVRNSLWKEGINSGVFVFFSVVSALGLR